MTWMGQFFNSVLPGSTGGDVAKIYQVCRLMPERKAAAASTVFVDRLSALVALLVLAAIAAVADPTGPALLAQYVSLPAAVAAVTALSAIGAGALWLGIRLLRGSALAGRFARTFAAARTSLTSGRDVGIALALAAAIHLLNFATVYFFARAIRLPITYVEILFMMPVVLFLVMLPITINGHGLRELLLVGYFSKMGIGVAGGAAIGVQEIAVAVSLLMVSNDLLWSLPGGLWYLTRFRAAASTTLAARAT